MSQRAGDTRWQAGLSLSRDIYRKRQQFPAEEATSAAPLASQSTQGVDFEAVLDTVLLGILGILGQGVRAPWAGCWVLMGHCASIIISVLEQHLAASPCSVPYKPHLWVSPCRGAPIYPGDATPWRCPWFRVPHYPYPALPAPTSLPRAVGQREQPALQGLFRQLELQPAATILGRGASRAVASTWPVWKC